jgi:hypothetical protein
MAAGWDARRALPIAASDLEHSPLKARRSTAFYIGAYRAGRANWWIVRSSDKQFLVVDIEPTGKGKSVTKISKEVYLTREEAEAEAKQLCK